MQIVVEQSIRTWRMVGGARWKRCWKPNEVRGILVHTVICRWNGEEKGKSRWHVKVVAVNEERFKGELDLASNLSRGGEVRGMYVG